MDTLDLLEEAESDGNNGGKNEVITAHVPVESETLAAAVFTGYNPRHGTNIFSTRFEAEEGVAAYIYGTWYGSTVT